MRLRKREELANVPHPFPYQGSKRGLAHAILPLVPPSTNRLIEPFCGSAAVSIAARYTRRAKTALIADINAPLIDLWNAILSDPGALADAYESMWHEQQADPREFFWKAREAFNANPRPAQLLYLLNRIVKGAVRYSKEGLFNQSPDHRRLGAKPAVVRERISSVSRTMAGTEAVVSDFAPLALAASRDDLVYMDPPYQGTTNVRDHRYMRGLPREEFEPVLAELVEREISFIVSYDAVREDGKYGQPISPSLGLTHLHLAAGRSAQATLLGQDDMTVESLYLSPALVARLNGDVATRPTNGDTVLDPRQTVFL